MTDVERRRACNRWIGSRRYPCMSRSSWMQRTLGRGPWPARGAEGPPPRRRMRCGRRSRRERTRHSLFDDFFFSSENWSRPATEIGDLLACSGVSSAMIWRHLHRDGRARARHRRTRRARAGHCAASQRGGRSDAEQHAPQSRRRFNYGSRQEIANAAQRLARESRGRKARSRDRQRPTVSGQLSRCTGYSGSRSDHRTAASSAVEFPDVARRPIVGTRVRPRSSGRTSTRRRSKTQLPNSKRRRAPFRRSCRENRIVTGRPPRRRRNAGNREIC